MAQIYQPSALQARHSLTRRDVARHVGVSTSTVRRMEFVQLHPVPDEHGVNRFDPAELEGLEPRRAKATVRPRRGLSEQERERARAGRLAAQVFRLFARDASLAHIVLTTKQPPERIRELYHEWNTSLFEGEWQRGR